MSFRVPDSEFARWIREGLIPDVPRPAPPQVKGEKRKPLLPSCHVQGGTWLIGVDTYSITNSRDVKAGIARKGHQKRSVYRAMALKGPLLPFADESIHKGKLITVKLTRIGGRTMDDDNLPAALKYVRDAVADILGIDDGTPLIRWLYGQEQGESVGVRVEMIA